MRIANAIGNFNSRVILTLLYFTIILPFGLAVRIFADPLRIRNRRRSSLWSPTESPEPSLDSARRQF